MDFLAELVGDGATLETGIGTGRIALPLNRRGVRATHGGMIGCFWECRWVELRVARLPRLQVSSGPERLVMVGE